jgi:hypothetical protein
MTDVYGTWLEAGNNLQPYGAWIARNWPNLTTALALAAFACWSIRKASRRVDNALAELHHDTDQQRKERQQ